VLVLAAMTMAQGNAGAQGFGFGLPSLPSLFGRPASALLEGDIKPDLYVGWLESERGLQFGLETDTPGPVPIDVRSYDLNIPTRGVWFGAAFNFPVREKITVVGRGWYLVPSNKTADGQIILGFPVRESQESTDTNWWYIDALAAYSLVPGFSVVGGVRYEHLQNTLKSREWEGFPPAFVTGESDLDFANWIPLFGLVCSAGAGPSSLSVSALFTPVFWSEVEGRMGFTAPAPLTGGPGVVEVTDTVTKGYFYELMAEYSAEPRSDVRIGAFARLSGIRGETDDLKFTWSGASWPPGTVVPPYSMAFNRMGWTFGGKIDIEIDLARLIPF
jgi:hypothetical protein